MLISLSLIDSRALASGEHYAFRLLSHDPDQH